MTTKSKSEIASDYAERIGVDVGGKAVIVIVFDLKGVREIADAPGVAELHGDVHVGAANCLVAKSVAERLYNYMLSQAALQFRSKDAPS